MSENCSSSCSSCGETCGSRKEPQDLSKKPHPLSNIKKVIGVVSGKGGVGKSMVTSLLALEMLKRGKKTGILDADITGPSIPKAFGLKAPLMAGQGGAILPKKTAKGIDVVSVNLMLKNETDPVLWRSPIITGTVNQFWEQAIWEDVDYLFIDMPPGTGDVSLTVFQSIKVDGIIIVASPQELVSMIVAKAVKMAEMMQIPIIGLVENYSYFRCPDTGKEYKIFGESHLEQIAEKHKLKIISRMPVDPLLAENVDSGTIEEVEVDYLSQAGDVLEAL